MNIKKLFIKIIAAVLLISCIAVSVAVFYKSKRPAEPVKTERQLREEVLQRHLESKGRSRTGQEDIEPVTADIFVIDSNTAPPPDMPADAIVVTSPEDINSAIADYLRRSEPNEEIRMVNISEILEERRLAQIRSRARDKQIISDERINKIIEQGVRDGVLVIPSGQPGQQLTDSTTSGGGVGTTSPSTSKMPAVRITVSKRCNAA